MRYELVIGLLVAAVVAGGVVLGSTGSLPVQTGEAPETGTATATAEAEGSVAASLSPEEVEGILYMREEEKLARDVYLTLYEMYGLQIFRNIAESEQRHMDAVLSLIEKYGLEDPAVDEVGVFTNPELQELYNQLIERASQGVVEAVLVGALIEEKDIIDINKLIEQTDNPDIIRVFTNLVNGSANHLKAFAAEYERLTGEPYQPQLLSQEQYEAVVASAKAGPEW